MKIINVDDIDSSQNPHNVDARKIYDTDYGQAVHIT